MGSTQSTWGKKKKKKKKKKRIRINQEAWNASGNLLPIPSPLHRCNGPVSPLRRSGPSATNGEARFEPLLEPPDGFPRSHGSLPRSHDGGPPPYHRVGLRPRASPLARTLHWYSSFVPRRIPPRQLRMGHFRPLRHAGSPIA